MILTRLLRRDMDVRMVTYDVCILYPHAALLTLFVYLFNYLCFVRFTTVLVAGLYLYSHVFVLFFWYIVVIFYYLWNILGAITKN